MKFGNFSLLNIGNMRILPIVFMILSLCANASFVGAQQREFGRLKIKNFGKIDENIYRGGQPNRKDFNALAEMGIKTVIDLQEDASPSERAEVEATGMHYINIPMKDKSMPKDQHIAQFLKITDDTSQGPYFVHCAGGRHRTGVVVAAYRINHYNWTIEQAYTEMKDYDFYTSWGHGDYKDYIFNYYSNYKLNHPSNGPTTLSAEKAH